MGSKGRQLCKIRKNNSRMKENLLHTLKRKQQHKNTYPKKKQETGHDANTNCTIVSHNINHDTNIVASSTSNIQNIQLDETPLNAEREDPLSSNEEVEAQVQTQQNIKENNTNTDRQQNRKWNKCVDTGQGNNQRKYFYTMICKGYPLQYKIWKF